MRCLPIAVPPAQHEIVTSYIARLATLHGLDSDELWEQISVPRTHRLSGRNVVPDQLAALTGRPVELLAAALVELRPQPDWPALRHTPQPGCPCCAARHPGGPVIQLLPPPSTPKPSTSPQFSPRPSGAKSSPAARTSSGISPQRSAAAPASPTTAPTSLPNQPTTGHPPTRSRTGSRLAAAGFPSNRWLSSPTRVFAVPPAASPRQAEQCCADTTIGPAGSPVTATRATPSSATSTFDPPSPTRQPQPQSAQLTNQPDQPNNPCTIQHAR